MSTSTPLARALREFCADHLPEIRGMSPHTVCSYRDAFTLLLRFLAQRRRRSVVKLDFDDLAPDRIIAFLHHLETVRGNAATTRNARLAAIHAFVRFVAANHPEHIELCQRILAVALHLCDLLATASLHRRVGARRRLRFANSRFAS